MGRIANIFDLGYPFFMDAKLTPIERKVSSNRKTRVFMMRKSYAEVQKNLSPDMEDACNEIEAGFNCISGHMGFPNADIGRVRGSDGAVFQDWSIKVSRRLQEWRNEVGSDLTSPVIDYIVFGKPFNQIAFETGIARQTISGRFYEGLREYCKMHFK